MIPKQLQKDSFRFIKVTARDKKAFELGWQNTANYKYSDQALLDWIRNGGNYGVVGKFGNLLIVDCDTPELEELSKNLPETFTIRTGGGGVHKYYICDDIERPIRLINKDNENIGDIQSKGKYVVGPNCLHSSGKRYKIEKDLPIASVSVEEIRLKFNKYIKSSDSELLKEENKYSNTEIDILDVVNVTNLKKHGRQYAGAHPIHGSVGGINFWVDPKKNCWRCFRCDSGGGALSWVAVEEGLIDCSEALPGKLTGNIFKKTLKLAKKKYNVAPKSIKNIGNKIIQHFNNKLDLAKKFACIQPIYFDSKKIWWFWNAKKFRWTKVDDTDLMNAISKNSNANTINSKEKNEILEALRQIGRQNKPKNPGKYWVQFKDKIVDVKTGEEFKASPKYFITNPIPWKIGNSKETPTINKLFKEWVVKEGLQNESYIDTLYEIVAYTMLANIPIHRMFCLIGDGLNGKGTFLRLVENFVGSDNTTSTNMDVLTRNDFELSKLYCKLVVLIGEIDRSIFKKTAIIKGITGDDLVRIEFKGKDSFDTHLYATPIIACNTLPETTDKTAGFFRRWLIIDFPNQFNEKKDVLENIPDEEYENLANKSIEILKSILKKGEFTNDGTIFDKQRRYEERANPIEKFIREFCIKQADCKIKFSTFYQRFVEFLDVEKFKYQTSTGVGMVLSQKGYKNKPVPIQSDSGTKTSARFIMGLRWKYDEDNHETEEHW